MNNQQRAENAIKWIETLLKTRMKQGKGQLGDSTTGYCCLGVACRELGINYNPYDINEPKLVDLVGLRHEDGFAYNGGTRYSMCEPEHEALPILNDESDYSFNQIAKRLINQPREYFRPGVAKLIKKHFAEV